MKTKAEQIEEMVNILVRFTQDSEFCGEVAQTLYAAGYRKLEEEPDVPMATPEQVDTIIKNLRALSPKPVTEPPVLTRDQIFEAWKKGDDAVGLPPPKPSVTSETSL